MKNINKSVVPLLWTKGLEDNYNSIVCLFVTLSAGCITCLRFLLVLVLHALFLIVLITKIDLELQYFEFFSLLTIPHPWPIKNTDVVLL
jgi:maltodextrin utilization protein YvdJ